MGVIGKEKEGGAAEFTVFLLLWSYMMPFFLSQTSVSSSSSFSRSLGEIASTEEEKGKQEESFIEEGVSPALSLLPLIKMEGECRLKKADGVLRGKGYHLTHEGLAGLTRKDTL